MKRFYKEVSIVEASEGWRVLLDGRAVKTVGGRAQYVPTQGLAKALAQEWAGQGEEIDPAAFVYRDLTDYALDVIAQDSAEAIAALVPYAETDTLCYRADPDEPFYPRQCRFGIRFWPRPKNAWAYVLNAFRASSTGPSQRPRLRVCARNCPRAMLLRWPLCVTCPALPHPW
jgi:hypothetical protein